MAKIVLPNSLDLPLPTEWEPSSGRDQGRKRLVEFGVELEGLVPLANIGHDKTITELAQQHASLAKKIQENTNLKTTAFSGHVHRQGWKVKSDESIKYDFEMAGKLLTPAKAKIARANVSDDLCIAEVMSPVLNGNDGLREMAKIFDCLECLDFQTNQSCALHVHVSLGWEQPIRGNDLDEVKNIYRAFAAHQDFFRGLVDSSRHSNPYCYPNPVIPEEKLEKFSSIVYLVNEYSRDGNDRRHMLNLHAAISHGTVEFKMKEADNYRDAIGYVRFLVAFTYEAAKNPEITPEYILGKYFAPTAQPSRGLTSNTGSVQPLALQAT